MAEQMDKMAALELAIKNEKSEMEFYLHEAERSTNPLAKGLFETAANDEREHMRRIHGLHQTLIEKGEWPADVTIEVAGTNIRDTLDGLVGEVGSIEDHDMDDEKALERAIAFEQKGMEFYQKLVGVCDNPKEKEFFRFLAKIEREHFLMLTDSLFYLRDPEAWMEMKEKPHIDGG